MSRKSCLITWFAYSARAGCILVYVQCPYCFKTNEIELVTGSIGRGGCTFCGSRLIVSLRAEAKR